MREERRKQVFCYRAGSDMEGFILGELKEEI